MPEKKDRYAVVGNPISHSKSPLLHTSFAKQSGQDILYTAECVEPSLFAGTIKDFFNNGGKGLNITVPFKQDAFELADELTERAHRAGAVNTLLLQKGKILGDNTDGIGLVTDIENNLQWQLKDKDILILGAGGAVRGVLEPLLNSNPKKIMIANRTLSKAEQLADNFSHLGNIHACAYDDLEGTFDIVINGTSASLGGERPALPDHILSPTSYCYDMMYAKEATPFIEWSKDQGATSTSDGLGMLVCQGAESFFLWRGVKPQTQPVIHLLRREL